MQKVIKSVLVITCLSVLVASCTGSNDGLEKTAEFNILPDGVQVYYSKGGAKNEYYKNGEKIFENSYDDYDLAAFTARGDGYTIQFYPKSGSDQALIDLKPPSENVVTIHTESGEYQTYWSYNNWKIPVHDGKPIYEFCTKSEYSELKNNNECIQSQLKYGDVVLSEINGVIYFNGLWDGVFVYHDYFDNVYSVDLNSEEKLVKKIASTDEGLGFSFFKGGVPVFYTGTHSAFLGGANVLLNEKIESSVAAEGISQETVYFIKLIPYGNYDYENEWYNFNIISEDNKISELRTLSYNLQDFDLNEMGNVACSFELSILPLQSNNNPCIFGENIFWLEDNRYTSESQIVLNGRIIILPENFYLPSLSDPYNQELFSPYMDIDHCLEEVCLVVDAIAPVFGIGKDFTLLIKAHDLWRNENSVLYYLNYENGQYASTEIIDTEVKDFYGVIQK